MDKDTTVADLKSRVFDFCEERHWNKSHNPKDLSIGISTEANELMDLFRFKSNDQMKEMMKDKKKRERIGEALADTLIFSLRFAQMYAFDIDDIIRDKMVKNAVKYPKPEK